MLKTIPDKDEIHAAIAAEIRSLPGVEEAALKEITPASELNAHLGLSSLQMAELVVALEMRFSVDPFSSLVPITDIRTLGDLTAAYERALQGEKAGIGRDATPVNESLLAAQQRARTRRRR